MQKRWHYLYVIVYPALGYKLYYGSRICDAHPDADWQYFGSSITFARYNDATHREYQIDALKIVLWAQYQRYTKRSVKALSQAEATLIKTALDEQGAAVCLNRNIAGQIYMTPEERSRALDKSRANGGGFTRMTQEEFQRWAGSGGKKSARLKKGLHGMTPEARRAAQEKGRETIRRKYAKTYTFCTPYGRTVTITNLREFCRLHHLNAAHMRSVHIGRIRAHRGWRKPDAQ